MRVVAIHTAPGRRLSMRSVDEVTAEAGKGLVGDRYHGSRRRRVTVQSRESLDAAAADLGHDFPCSATRRNVTVDTGQVPDRPGKKFRIGEVDVVPEVAAAIAYGSPLA